MFVRHKGDAKVIMFADPQVLITPLALMKMWHYVDLSVEEVSWLGTADVLASGDYLIDDVFLVEQTVTSAETEMSTEGVAKLYEELVAVGREADAGRLRVWGHSHVNMGTSPSANDIQQGLKLAEDADAFFIRIIANKAGRLEASLYLMAEGLQVVDAQWEVHYAVAASVGDIKAELKAKVSKRTYEPQVYQGWQGGHNGKGGRQYWDHKAQEWVDYDPLDVVASGKRKGKRHDALPVRTSTFEGGRVRTFDVNGKLVSDKPFERTAAALRGAGDDGLTEDDVERWADAYLREHGGEGGEGVNSGHREASDDHPTVVDVTDLYGD